MIKAIIVDDESKSIKNLEFLITAHCKDVSIVKTANNALEAVKLILQEKPDVVFLDVQMPGYNGFDVLEQIKEIEVKIIFTTAHKEYAIEALRKGAFDYLLKPIDVEDLKNCLNRVTGKVNKSSVIYPNTIELSVKDGIIFIKPKDIVRLEASGSYTTIYLDNGVKHLASKSMKEYEKFLDPTLFYRCHNSHVINLKKVVKFISNNGLFAEMNNGSVAEIAKKNKEEFLMKLKKGA
ncbi:MAG TPA: LytTR family DNA-binding domain-containing protein [Bacteroidia bacterium]|jgi:two-component system LytT family response regulator|nr:LytTR family DNA-binding domain-containing protein [Bacteroidia bacterium]